MKKIEKRKINLKKEHDNKSHLKSSCAVLQKVSKEDFLH